jgi:hypothetical protein
MHPKILIGTGCILFVVTCWAADGQVAPPRCACSEPQELHDAVKPTRAAPPMIWNCTCGRAQCVIAHAPTNQAEVAMNCLLTLAPQSEEALASPKAQEKRPKGALR